MISFALFDFPFSITLPLIVLNMILKRVNINIKYYTKNKKGYK